MFKKSITYKENKNNLLPPQELLNSVYTKMLVLEKNNLEAIISKLKQLDIVSGKKQDVFTGKGESLNCCVDEIIKKIYLTKFILQYLPNNYLNHCCQAIDKLLQDDDLDLHLIFQLAHNIFEQLGKQNNIYLKLIAKGSKFEIEKIKKYLKNRAPATEGELLNNINSLLGNPYRKDYDHNILLNSYAKLPGAIQQEIKSKFELDILFKELTKGLSDYSSTYAFFRLSEYEDDIGKTIFLINNYLKKHSQQSNFEEMKNILSQTVPILENISFAKLEELETKYNTLLAKINVLTPMKELFLQVHKKLPYSTFEKEVYLKDIQEKKLSLNHALQIYFNYLIKKNNLEDAYYINKLKSTLIALAWQWSELASAGLGLWRYIFEIEDIFRRYRNAEVLNILFNQHYESLKNKVQAPAQSSAA